MTDGQADAEDVQQKLKEELIHLLSTELLSNEYDPESHVHFDTLLPRLYQPMRQADVAPPAPLDTQTQTPSKQLLLQFNALDQTFNKLKYIVHVYLSLVRELALKLPKSSDRCPKRNTPSGAKKPDPRRILPIDAWICGGNIRQLHCRF